MLVLALDTSTAVASIALVEDGATLVEMEGPAEAKHGETLLTVVEAALARAGVKLGRVDLLAVGIGPGSFTGVRVGLATAKGLALATGKSLVGVVSLRAMGRTPVSSGGLVASVLDAYRNEVYAALYRSGADGKLIEVLSPLNQGAEQIAPRVAQLAASEPVVLCGNGARRYSQHFISNLGSGLRWAEPYYDTPRASALAREAMATFEESGPSDLLSLEPFYIRPSDAQPLRSG